MSSDEDWEYLDPGFDPQKLRIADLRRIFLRHDVNTGGAKLKAELVAIFNSKIAPRRKELRATFVDVEPSSQGIQDATPPRLTTVQGRQARAASPPDAQQDGQAAFLPESPTPEPPVSPLRRHARLRSPTRPAIAELLGVSPTAVAAATSPRRRKAARNISTTTQPEVEEKVHLDRVVLETPSRIRRTPAGRVAPASGRVVKKSARKVKPVPEVKYSDDSVFDSLHKSPETTKRKLPDDIESPPSKVRARLFEPVPEVQQPDQADSEADSEMDRELSYPPVFNGRPVALLNSAVPQGFLPSASSLWVSEEFERSFHPRSQLESSFEPVAINEKEEEEALTEEAFSESEPEIKPEPEIEAEIQPEIQAEPPIEYDFAPDLTLLHEEVEEPEEKVAEVEEVTQVSPQVKTPQAPVCGRSLGLLTLKALGLFFGTLALLTFAHFSLWFISERTNQGFCDVHLAPPPNEYPWPLAEPWTEPGAQAVQEWLRGALDQVRPGCIPCPEHAVCLADNAVVCETGYELVLHPLSFGGRLPVAPYCVKNMKHQRRLKQLTQAAAHKLHQRNAEVQCRERPGPASMSESELKEALIAQQTLATSQLEVTSMWEEIMRDLPGLPEIEYVTQVAVRSPSINKSLTQDPLNIDEQQETRTEAVLVSHSLMHMSLLCRVRSALMGWFLRHRQLFYNIIGGLVLVAVAGSAIFYFYARKRWRARFVEEIYATLKQQSDIAAADRNGLVERLVPVRRFREKVSPRNWKAIKDTVENNKRIRTRTVEINGEIERTWELDKV